MKQRKVLGQLISLSLTAILLVFAYYYIVGLVEKIDLSDLTVNWWLVMLSGLSFILFYGLLSLHWVVICRLVDRSSGGDQMLAFFASQPYKYLPTSLFTFSFRAVYAQKLGLNLKKSSAAQLIENISMLSTNIGIFGVFYLMTISAWLALLLTMFLLVALAFVSDRNTLTVKLRKKTLSIRTSLLTRAFLIASIAWLAAGTSFVALNQALGLPVDLFGYLAACIVSFALSILAFFAPGGIGVREVVFGAFGVSALAIVAWRIFTFVADMVLGLLAVLMIYKKQARASGSGAR